MGITNYGKNQVTILIGGSLTSGPSYYKIGTGSSTVQNTDTDLLTSTDRQEFTSTSFPNSTQVQFQGDWNVTEMSGIQLAEFGIAGSNTALQGSIWSRTVIPSLTFDGTNELRIQETWEVF